MPYLGFRPGARCAPVGVGARCAPVGVGARCAPVLLLVVLSLTTGGCSSNAGSVARPALAVKQGEPAGDRGGPSAGSGAGSDIIVGGQAPEPAAAPTRGPANASPANPDQCRSVSQTAQVIPGQADIVWIIDGSPSMLDELAAVQQNLQTFANQISSAGIDHRVVFVAGSDVAAGTPLGADTDHYRFVPGLIGSNNALQILLDTYPVYMDFLRPDAPLHFVVVTDDNSFLPHANFQSQMEALAGKSFYFHSIASEDAPGPCIGACGLPLVCGAFAPGSEYYALSERTGGEKISICTPDWSQVFGPLQAAVIASAPLPCSYPIPAPPMGQSLDPDKVNVEFVAQASAETERLPRTEGADACADTAAWHYDDPSAPSTLELCPSACTRAQAGGTVHIAFGCETLVVK